MTKALPGPPQDARAAQTSPRSAIPRSEVPGSAIPRPVALPPRDRRPRRTGLPGRLDPYLLAVALFVAYTALSLARYRHLATRSWDLGIFEQAVRAYAHLQAPVVDLKGPGANVLGDHFSPVTALLAPVYRVFPSPSPCSSRRPRCSRCRPYRSPVPPTGSWGVRAGSRSASRTACPGASSVPSTSTSTRSASPYP